MISKNSWQNRDKYGTRLQLGTPKYTTVPFEANTFPYKSILVSPFNAYLTKVVAVDSTIK